MSKKKCQKSGETHYFENPVLYILMRTDMASMNPGKGMAQACHAANQFVFDIRSKNEDSLSYPSFKLWEQSTPNGFGTTIVLGATEKQILEIEHDLTKYEVWIGKDNIPYCPIFEFGKTVDPTYPLKDGQTMHFIPVMTCAYLFADKDNDIIKQVLNKLELYP